MDKNKLTFLLGAGVSVLAVFLFGHWFLNGLAAQKLIERTLAIPLDEKIPFLPIFVYFYVMAYFIYTVGLGLICLRQTREDIKRTFRAVLFIVLISFFVYFIFPVKVPWPDIEGKGIGVQILNLLHSFQKPYNTFPSLHVAFVTIVNCLLWRQNKIRGLIFLPVAITVSLSTVFTKQHVILDVPAGVLISLISFWIFFRKRL